MPFRHLLVVGWMLLSAMLCCSPPNRQQKPSTALFTASAVPVLSSVRSSPTELIPDAPELPPARATSSASAVASASSARLRLHLVPIGTVPSSWIDHLVVTLPQHAALEVAIEPSMELPAAAKVRGASALYHAGALLDRLSALSFSDAGKCLGITTVDIVAPKGGNPTWGILGLGTLDGRASVLSTYRMKRVFEHGGVSDDVVRERLWKTAVHEIGHTLGLPHCPTAHCIMEDGHGTVRTTDQSTSLCPSCRARYDQAIAQLIASEATRP